MPKRRVVITGLGIVSPVGNGIAEAWDNTINGRGGIGPITHDDKLKPGQYAVSSSNRNFEGRQGPGGRTFLASPLTVVASAISGVVSDVRDML